MTKMGKVLLTVLVLMLTCFLVIGAGSSEVRAKQKKIKIEFEVDPITGHVASVKAKGLDGKALQKDQLIPPFPKFQHVATVGFFSKNNPTNCYILVIGGYAYEFCW